MTVTYSTKRYIYVCIGCDGLAESCRKDQVTCSPACRVRAQRNGEAKRTRETATALDIHPGMLLQSRALLRLRPDLADMVTNGELALADTREAVHKAFTQAVLQQSHSTLEAQQ